MKLENLLCHGCRNTVVHWRFLHYNGEINVSFKMRTVVRTLTMFLGIILSVRYGTGAGWSDTQIVECGNVIKCNFLMCSQHPKDSKRHKICCAYNPFCLIKSAFYCTINYCPLLKVCMGLECHVG